MLESPVFFYVMFFFIIVIYIYLIVKFLPGKLRRRKAFTEFLENSNELMKQKIEKNNEDLR